MKLHELSPVPGSHKKPKRIGFGVGSGHGKTACKGHKGHKARAGGGVRPGFEGGQMPLVRRIPKRGFSNFRHMTRYETVNVDVLDSRFESGTEVTLELMVRAGVASGKNPVKVLGNGEITKSLKVKADAFSASAVRKIEAAGGSTEVA